MRRREFITLLGGTAVAWPLAANAQQGGAIRLIGVLMDFAESDPAAQSEVAAFRGALAKSGPYNSAHASRPRRRGDRIMTLFAAVHESAFDAVDGSSTGT